MPAIVGAFRIHPPRAVRRRISGCDLRIAQRGSGAETGRASYRLPRNPSLGVFPITFRYRVFINRFRHDFRSARTVLLRIAIREAAWRIALTTAALVTAPMSSVSQIWVDGNSELSTAASMAAP